MKGKMDMIHMIFRMKDEFPELFTKQGFLKKREPKKYKCSCGHTFSKTKKTNILMGIQFAIPLCDVCGEKGTDNIAYNVWVRLNNKQMEQEDFILNTVNKHGTITKEEVERKLSNSFLKKTDALSTLVYYGYLQVDAVKRDKWNMIEYSINPNKELDKRYELIR